MPAMLPMYILSTMLYSTLTICASMVGMASRQTSGKILSRPKSFVCRTRNPSKPGHYTPFSGASKGVAQYFLPDCAF